MTNKTRRSLRVGINGFGRIGRALFRILDQRGQHQVVHINDLLAANPEQIRYLTEFDSLYGRFPRKATVKNGHLIIHQDGSRKTSQISLSSLQSTIQVDWQSRGVEVVVEATGDAQAMADCRYLLEKAVSYVIVTSNFNQADFTIIPGVDSSDVIPSSSAVISTATCDVIAAGPLVHALLPLGGIEHLRIVTLHPWLNYQSLLDSPLAPQSGAVNQGNYGLGRAATMSVIPKATSLESALASIFPTLKDRIQAHSYRVPTPIVCYGDMCIDFESSVTRDDVLNLLTQKEPVIGLTEDAFASVDFIAERRSAILDLRWLRVDKNRVVLVYAYDNEWGYANYVADIIDRIARHMGGI